MTPEQRAEIERRDRSAVHGDDDSPECMQAVSDRHVLLEALVMAEQRANAYHDALADAHRETAEQAAEIKRMRKTLSDLAIADRERELELKRMMGLVSFPEPDWSTALRKTAELYAEIELSRSDRRAALRELSNDADELGDYTG